MNSIVRQVVIELCECNVVVQRMYKVKRVENTGDSPLAFVEGFIYVAWGHVPCVWSGESAISFLHSSSFTKHFSRVSHSNVNVCIFTIFAFKLQNTFQFN